MCELCKEAIKNEGALLSRVPIYAFGNHDSDYATKVGYLDLVMICNKETEWPFYLENAVATVANDNDIVYDTMPIKYCPFCGEDLENLLKKEGELK